MTDKYRTCPECGTRHRDRLALDSLTRAPNIMSWDWQLPSGGTMRVEIIGRWADKDIRQIDTLFPLIRDIIADSSEDKHMASPRTEKGP